MTTLDFKHKQIQAATSRAVSLGHDLKPWGPMCDIEASQCKTCGMSIFVDVTGQRWGDFISGPAARHQCSAAKLQQRATAMI